MGESRKCVALQQAEAVQCMRECRLLIFQIFQGCDRNRLQILVWAVIFFTAM
jgi:hypothetical protein